MGITNGKFFRDAKLYCINLLLTYGDGCVGRCAYCGLSGNRETDKPWEENSFIRVDWPTISMDEIIARMRSSSCSHVERVCVSMVTNAKACGDTLTLVKRLREEAVGRISALITPTIVDRAWLHELKGEGADMVGIAIDAATHELFERLRGREVGGPHGWNRYWQTVEEAVEVFGRRRVGVHLIVGLGETEEEMVKTIQRAHDMGAATHLFSFFPEQGSPMQAHPQPPIGKYRRVQLARYLINNGVTSATNMCFDEDGVLRDFDLKGEELVKIVDGGLPFMTSGCPGEKMENACNRPFANCTPYQAYLGLLRNYSFPPNKEDVKLIKKQLSDYSNTTNEADYTVHKPSKSLVECNNDDF